MVDDDWRYRKAQQLGLIDTSPFGAPGASPFGAPGDGCRPTAPAPPPQRADWTPPPATPSGAGAFRPKATAPKVPSDGRSRLAFAGGTALALLAAAAAGWLLNDAVGQRTMAEFPPPVVQAARPATPVIEAIASAAKVPVPGPAPDPAPLRVETALPPPVTPPVEVPAPLRARAVAPAIAPPPRVTIPKPGAVAARGQSAGATTLPRGRGPSFNCRRARTPDSRIICASPELSGLDRALARSYRNAVLRAGPSAEYRLDRQQSAFLNARAACQSAPCIARIYYRRLERLDGT